MIKKIDKEIETLKNRGLVVMPSDTVYGIFCDAHNPVAIERLYVVRKRNLGKACIVLIHSIDDLKSFDISLSQEQRDFLNNLPDTQASTFILRSENDQFTHIHRNLRTIAFRVPRDNKSRGKRLREILKQTGPLLAPSANTAGNDPAQTIDEAKQYFGNKVDLYIDYGEPLHAEPSSIYDLTGSAPHRIR